MVPRNVTPRYIESNTSTCAPARVKTACRKVGMSVWKIMVFSLPIFLSNFVVCKNQIERKEDINIF